MIGKPLRKIIQQMQLHQIYPGCISKIKSNCEKQVIILMIRIDESNYLNDSYWWFLDKF